MNWDRRFDPDGELEPIGTDLTFDTAGLNFFPSLRGVRDAVRSIIADSTYRIDAGAFRTALDADVRQFPFNFQFGLSDRLTLTASIPVVTTRMQADFTVDSSDATVGWNQVAPTSGNATALQDVINLLNQFDASAASLEALINGGAFGCPSGPQCADAQNLLDRSRTLNNDLVGLTGVSADGSLADALPPFAPLASSSAGQALLAAIQGVAAALQAFGAQAVSATLPLPQNRLSAEDVSAVFTNPAFGYDAFALEFVKYRQRLGDLELGVRWSAIQTQSLRAVLSTTLRLPTALQESPSHFIDIGTGDKQTDIETTLEAAFEPGSSVGIAVAASYTRQLSDRLPRRLAAANRPIALASTEQTVSRNLGDTFSISAYPTLRLTPGFRTYGSIQYVHKGSDRFSGLGSLQVLGGSVDPPTLADLELETSMKSLSVGGGIHFRSTGLKAGTLPIEAGMHYRAVFQGSGGLTPKATSLNFYLRLFFRLLGGEEEEEQEAAAKTVNR